MTGCLVNEFEESFVALIHPDSYVNANGHLSSLVMETSGKPKWRTPNELNVHFVRVESSNPFL